MYAIRPTNGRLNQREKPGKSRESPGAVSNGESRYRRQALVHVVAYKRKKQKIQKSSQAGRRARLWSERKRKITSVSFYLLLSYIYHTLAKVLHVL